MRVLTPKSQRLEGAQLRCAARVPWSTASCAAQCAAAASEHGRVAPRCPPRPRAPEGPPLRRAPPAVQ